MSLFFYLKNFGVGKIWGGGKLLKFVQIKVV